MTRFVKIGHAIRIVNMISWLVLLVAMSAVAQTIDQIRERAR